MKPRLFKLCVLLVAVAAICSVSYAAAPALPPGSSIMLIPGGPSTCTATTYTYPAYAQQGCGPSCATVVCSQCAPCVCPSAPCYPCPAPTCTTTTVCPTSASIGCGPCATCSTVAGLDANGRSMLACLKKLCGVDADRAYLQSMMQLNMWMLSLSDASATQLGATSLQDFATNSIADARSNITRAKAWLKSKFCMTVTACVPGVSPSLNICNTIPPSKAFDDAYKNQMIQYYVDEIALSQVEVAQGLDCQVKAFAQKTIENDQARIYKLTRCRICG